MSNINLFESAQGKNNPNSKGFNGGKALLVPVVVLVAAFFLLGAAKLGLMYFEKQNDRVVAEKKLQSETMNGKNVDRVADFDERMNRSLAESAKRDDYSGYLKELEGLMVSGARVEYFSYSPENSEIKMLADNFKTVARQMLSFKNSKDFKDFKLISTSYDKDGNLSFDLKK